MNIAKAVVTAAGSTQRNLPLQNVIDRDGTEKSLLRIIVEEALRGGVEEICLVVSPGDEKPYANAVGEHAGRLHFVRQEARRGYGHAVYCARDFVGDEPFLHMVGDHLYLSRSEKGCAEQLIAVAQQQACPVSTVHPTRENLLPYFGTVGGRPVRGHSDLYRIEQVIEKPTPTQAEQELAVSGLRAGHYLCFFGMHVLTPTVFDLLGAELAQKETDVGLAEALGRLAQREQYLAQCLSGSRYDAGIRYGLFTAQLALALEGRDRDEVLAKLLTLVATRESTVGHQMS